MYKRHSQAIYLGDLRGRTAGKIAHLERIANDVATQLAEARKDLEAVDRIIKQFDPRIDPTSIPSIHGGKKLQRGTRGGLVTAVRAIMEKAPVGGMTSHEVLLALQLQHDLVFETPQEFKRYLNNVVRCCLQDLEKMGILQRTVEDSLVSMRPYKRWRLRGAGTSIESMVADANAHGAEVRIIDAEASSSGEDDESD
jgi:hypothetical protein